MAFTPVQKLSIGTGAALGLLALVGLVAWLSISQMIRGERAVAGTNGNIARLDRVVARTVDAENAQRGFVTTGDSAYLAPLDAAQGDVEFALDSLRGATEDNPEQRTNLEQLAGMVSKRFSEIRATVASRSRFGLDSAVRRLQAETAMRGRGGAGVLANRMRDEELRVLGERTRVMTTKGQAASNFILVGSILAFVLAGVALMPLQPAVEKRLAERLSTAMVSPLHLTVDEEAQHTGDRLVRLQQVIKALSVPMTEMDVAQALLTRGAPPLVASLGFVVTRRNDGFVVVRALGDVVSHLSAGAAVPANLAAPLLDAAKSLDSVVAESRAERMRRYPALGRFSESGTSDGAFVAAPLTAGSVAYGVLVLAFADNRAFTDEERAYLTTLGRLGGQALSRVATNGGQG